MNGCLACKACATQCPVKVDVPNLRAQFLEQYHTRYRRPLKDYFVVGLEALLRVLVLWPKLSNFCLGLNWVQRALRWVGIVDTPMLAEQTLVAGLRRRNAVVFDQAELAKLSADEKARTVLIAQDAFTTFYEPGVTLAAYDLLTRLGRRVVVLPFVANGKALHVKGFLSWFRRVAARGVKFYARAAELGIPIVGIEPAVTLTYRDEYPHALGESAQGFRMLLLQEYLNAELPAMLATLGAAAPKLNSHYRLFGHCTERTAEPQSQHDWRRIFSALGAELELEATGCCGMCGVFGHEAEHVTESRGVFAMSWGKRLPKDAAAQIQILATGHSCRSQVKRFAGFVPRHPIEALAHALAQG